MPCPLAGRVRAPTRRKPASINRHQSIVTQCSKGCRCTIRPAKFLFVEVGLLFSARPRFSHGVDTRDARAPFSPRRPRARETAAMATTYFARPKLQVFGVATGFVVRKIGLSDLTDALRLGWEDFKAIPTHAVVLCLIYPVLGLVLFRMVLGHSLLPLLFPLAAGFTLIGPFAGLGLYELSRRRERGEEAAAWDAMQVLRSPSFGAILGLGMFLLVLFGTWIAAADVIYIATFGYAPAASIPDFATRVLTTPEGWTLIIVGCGVGFLFAVAALCISVVSFPLMLDRRATAIDAIRTSIRAVMLNPIEIAAWGLVVAVLLALGSLPFFVGLCVVLPVLGHATWHLYRKLVEPDPNPPEEQPRPPIGHRYAADFPASLFPWSRER